MHSRGITEVGLAGRLGLACLPMLTSASCGGPLPDSVECGNGLETDSSLQISGIGESVVFIRTCGVPFWGIGQPPPPMEWPMLHSLVTQQTLQVPWPDGRNWVGVGSVSVSDNGRLVALCGVSDLDPAPDSQRTSGTEMYIYDLAEERTTVVDMTPIRPICASSAFMTSGDGRVVAFHGLNSSQRTGGFFVHERETGVTEVVSVDSEAHDVGSILSPSISDDGRYIAFVSRAEVSETSRAHYQVYVHDREAGSTRQVSGGVEGEAADRDCQDAVISGDGRFVAFWTSASNLVPEDTNGTFDVFLYDLQSLALKRVSVDSDGEQAELDTDIESPKGLAISGDGRFVAFGSHLSTLVPSDTNRNSDVFVHDIMTGKTVRISVTPTGEDSDGDSDNPTISSDGRFVAFRSYATNLGLEPGAGWFLHDIQTGETSRIRLE